MNSRRIFIASSQALVTTAMTFSARSDILDALDVDLHLTKERLGMLLSPAFWGFVVSIMIGGAVVDFLVMRRLLILSSLSHVTSVLAVLLAPHPAAVGSHYRDNLPQWVHHLLNHMFLVSPLCPVSLIATG